MRNLKVFSYSDFGKLYVMCGIRQRSAHWEIPKKH